MTKSALLSSHRSLFVPSAVGKLFHKLTRRKVQGVVDSGLHEFHLGARRPVPGDVCPLLFAEGPQPGDIGRDLVP